MALRVYLDRPTHDAHYNAASQTLFYIALRRRRLQRACAPFYHKGEMAPPTPLLYP